jgi:hypothetical protein
MRRYEPNGGQTVLLPCASRRVIRLCPQECDELTLGGSAASWLVRVNERVVQVGGWSARRGIQRWTVYLPRGETIDVAHTRRRLLVTVLDARTGRGRVLSATLRLL